MTKSGEEQSNWTLPYADVYPPTLGRATLIAGQFRAEQETSLLGALDGIEAGLGTAVTYHDLPSVPEGMASYGTQVNTSQLLANTNFLLKTDEGVDLQDYVRDTFRAADHRDVDVVRLRVAAFGNRARARLAVHVSDNNPVLYSEQEKKSGGGLATWFNWLVAKEGVANPASDRDIMDVLEWNVEYMDRLQHDPEFVGRVAEEKDSYKNWVVDGIDRRIHSPLAADAPDKVDALKVYIADPMDPGIVASGIVGYHTFGSDCVVLGLPLIKGKGTIFDQMLPVLPHEMNHAVLGGKRPYEQAFDEPLAEHFNVSKVSGDPYTINPIKRSGKEGIYRGYRLVKGEMQYGIDNHVVDAGYILRAYSGDEDDYEDVQDRFDTAWNTSDISKRVYADIDTEKARIMSENNRNNQWTALDMACDAVASKLREQRLEPGKNLFGEQKLA